MSSQLSSNRIVSRESSERGESSSGSSESTSGSLGPTYDWVEIAVRNTATTLRKPDDLDKVIAKAPLVRSGLPSDILWVFLFLWVLLNLVFFNLLWIKSRYSLLT